MINQVGRIVRAGAWATLALAAARAETLRVTTVAEVVAAVKRARAGDEIVLAGGEYQDVKLTLAEKGEAGKPLVLRAENVGRAVLTGAPGVVVSGDYVEVRGLSFKDGRWPVGARGALSFDAAGHGRITECSFENSTQTGSTSLVSFRNGAHDNRVDHCRFINTRYRSVVVAVDDKALKIGPSVRNRIDHNLFQDVPPLNANGAETIQIGQRAIPHSDLRPETVVEDNEFVRCDGEAEIISLKTTGNIIRNNVFRDCRGEVVMRHGHNNTVTGNRFEGGSGGIRISGHGHIVTGNTMTGLRGTGIRLYFGTPDLKHPGSYLPVYGCVITDNTIVNCGVAGIFIGDSKNAHHENTKWAGAPWFASPVMDCTVAPTKNRIAKNTITGKPGTLIKIDEAPGNTIEGNTLNERP
jgi:poly(beta-D-mannuronate) lyase